MSNILVKIIKHALIDCLRNIGEPVRRDELLNRVAASLGLHDCGQPGFAFSDVELALDELVRKGNAVQTIRRGTVAMSPAELFFVELPILDRIALEGD